MLSAIPLGCVLCGCVVEKQSCISCETFQPFTFRCASAACPTGVVSSAVFKKPPRVVYEMFLAASEKLYCPTCVHQSVYFESIEGLITHDAVLPGLIYNEKTTGSRSESYLCYSANVSVVAIMERFETTPAHAYVEINGVRANPYNLLSKHATLDLKNNRAVVKQLVPTADPAFWIQQRVEPENQFLTTRTPVELVPNTLSAIELPSVSYRDRLVAHGLSVDWVGPVDENGKSWLIVRVPETLPASVGLALANRASPAFLNACAWFHKLAPVSTGTKSPISNKSKLDQWFDELGCASRTRSKIIKLTKDPTASQKELTVAFEAGKPRIIAPDASRKNKPRVWFIFIVLHEELSEIEARLDDTESISPIIGDTGSHLLVCILPSKTAQEEAILVLKNAGRAFFHIIVKLANGEPLATEPSSKKHCIINAEDDEDDDVDEDNDDGEKEDE